MRFLGKVKQRVKVSEVKNLKCAAKILALIRQLLFATFYRKNYIAVVPKLPYSIDLAPVELEQGKYYEDGIEHVMFLKISP